MDIAFDPPFDDIVRGLLRGLLLTLGLLVQVWSGTEESGNNQVNIFRDTGYLVTSAVDGYNVCIFAYGQASKHDAPGV